MCSSCYCRTEMFREMGRPFRIGVIPGSSTQSGMSSTAALGLPACPPACLSLPVRPVALPPLGSWWALTGAKSSAAPEHVASWWEGRWVWIRRKGQRPKASASTSFSPPNPPPPHATLKQVVRPPPTERANLLKCVCLFEGKKKKWGWLFGSGTCCWSIRRDLILLNESLSLPLRVTVAGN